MSPKPCAGEPHARIDRGSLGRLTPIVGAADPGPVGWKMPPQWPGRDLNRDRTMLNQWPTLPTLQAVQLLDPCRPPDLLRLPLA